MIEMSIGLVVGLVVTAGCTILAVVLSNYFTAKHTREIIREGQENTQKILGKLLEVSEEHTCILNKLAKASDEHTCILNKLAKASDEHTEILKDNKEILKRLARIAHTTEHTLAKVAFFGKTSILLQGWQIGENVESREAAEKLGKVASYEPELRMCVYKPRGKKGATS
jgi:hypothetical protein